MFQPFSIFIGTRYSFNSHSSFISLITWIAIISLMLATGLLILVTSVMEGFEKQLQNRILGFIPHVNIESLEPLQDTSKLKEILSSKKNIAAVSDHVYMQSLVIKDGMQKVFTFGYDEQSRNTIAVHEFMQEGSLELLNKDWNIVIGKDLANKIDAKIDDEITFISSNIDITAAGVFPRTKRFKVVGIFQTGAGEIDTYMTFSNKSTINKFAKMPKGSSQGIRIKLDNAFDADKLAEEIKSKLEPGLYVLNWTQVYGWLYNAISREKTMVIILLSLFVAIAVFNLIAQLIMTAINKQGDIAILRTQGATKFDIVRIFVTQGLLIGCIGLALGMILGCIISINITDIIYFIEQVFEFKLLNSDVYFISYVPSSINFLDLLLIAIISLTLSFLATIYPAYRAANTNPVVVLRYE